MDKIKAIRKGGLKAALKAGASLALSGKFGGAGKFGAALTKGKAIFERVKGGIEKVKEVHAKVKQVRTTASLVLKTRQNLIFFASVSPCSNSRRRVKPSKPSARAGSKRRSRPGQAWRSAPCSSTAPGNWVLPEASSAKRSPRERQCWTKSGAASKRCKKSA